MILRPYISLRGPRIKGPTAKPRRKILNGAMRHERGDPDGMRWDRDARENQTHNGLIGDFIMPRHVGETGSEHR